jgi:cytochrome c biogenesis protein CcdA
LAFVAGVLTVLSPCVLPILPIVLGTAASERKYGPAALAAGLAFSFVIVGLLVSTIGYSIGLTAELFRRVAASLIVILGAVLMVPALQARFALASGPIANWTDRKFGTSVRSGYAGQFWAGVLLGAAWSPCVGAAQGRDLPQVALSMFVFGLGAALPLLIVGLISRQAMQRWGKQILSIGHAAKAGFGLRLVIIGILIVTSLDKRLETALVDASPQWLTDLTTRF